MAAAWQGIAPRSRWHRGDGGHWWENDQGGAAARRPDRGGKVTMPDPPVTIKDVAAAARVHPATASRALNPETRILVSDKTARRVLRAAKSLGYRPNPIARNLRTRRSRTIGVLIPDLTNPLFPPIIRGLEDRLADSGYVALIGNTDGDDARERLVFEQMRARHVDGFVLATARLKDPLLAEAARAELAVVLVNRVTDSYSFPAVCVDNERGSHLVACHLASLGHRDIACIAGPQDVSTGPSRLRGFMAGLQACGMQADADLITFATSYSIQEGLRCGRELVRGGRHWTAIAAANDMLAVGCYSALEEAGLRCPEDVSVVGFNDMPFIDRLRPALTSVRFPHYQVGTEAAQLLLERIGQRDGYPGAGGPGRDGRFRHQRGYRAHGGSDRDSHGGAGPGAITQPPGAAAGVKILFLAPELVVRGSSGPPARRIADGPDGTNRE
jgi:LacI family transcriptional regulator, galactose operon repressor